MTPKYPKKINPEPALNFFLPGEAIDTIAPLSSGNVNDTWLVVLASGEKLVLQRLRSAVFTEPDIIINNLRLVTEHLTRHQSLHKDSTEFFSLVTNPNNLAAYIDENTDHWRLLTYVANSRTLSALSSPKQATETGRMLGLFHLMIADIDPASLADPLPGFHVTPHYLQQYDSISTPLLKPNDLESFCLFSIENHRSCAPLLEEMKDKLRHQIIHGDPKVANFLFARNSEQVISLIDLDTVKPGLLLHDLGDCLRSCCNRLGEEADPPAETHFDRELFQAVLHGYTSVAAHLPGSLDQAYLVEAVKVISFELGLRFFTDYLTGNHYFKVRQPEQNLVRAAIQFYLHDSILRQQEELETIVAEVFRANSRRKGEPQGKQSLPHKLKTTLAFPKPKSQNIQ